jgi:hypothetical protein
VTPQALCKGSRLDAVTCSLSCHAWRHALTPLHVSVCQICIQDTKDNIAGLLLAHCCVVLLNCAHRHSLVCHVPYTPQDMVDNIAGMMLALLALATRSSGRSRKA